MSKEIIRQLKSLKHADTGPSEEWLKNNRELLLSQIRNTVSTKNNNRIKFNVDNFWQATSIFLPQTLVYRVIKPMTAIILILAMGVGSWVATVSASYESLPGEWLYSAKRATETFQSVSAEVVGNKNEAASLHGEFAKRRAVEIKSIVSQNDPSKIEIVSKTVNDLKQELNSVSNKLEEIKTTNGSTGEAAKNINQTTQDIQKVLKEVKVNLLINDVASTGDLSTQVSQVKDIAKETAVKAVEVMVEKHLQGDVSVSKDEVKAAINQQLQSAVTDAAESKQSMVEVNKAVGIVKTEVNAAIVQDIKNSSTSNNTQELSDKIEETSKQTQAAVNTAQQFNVKTGETVSEGQILLSQDNLSLAVGKIKEANAVSTQVEKITDDTLKAVQGILPVVAVAADAPLTASTSIFVTTTPVSSSLSVGVTTSNTIKINVSTTPVIVPKPTTTLR
ncbi:MAG: hypothetical protein KBC69_02525 [Candidatus Magasanikbacteria bacterium]|nr:hypothetical protein [Candidatus Magasanikbacteria bacterium]